MSKMESAYSLPEMDLWQTLAATQKPIVMYGMGNGADKILAVCQNKGIEIADFFASDGFVRGHSFHGKTVLSYQAVKEKYGAGNFIVLLSFATSLPQVMENIRRIAAETTLFAPDVPVFGDNLFDLTFYRAHETELADARALLADDESRRIFDRVIRYKLTGDIAHLAAAENDPDCVVRELLSPQTWQSYLDLGAYNGDTVRRTLEIAPQLKTVWAFEPDRRNFRKLEAYARTETRADVKPYALGAWSHRDTLIFDSSGNRNAHAMPGMPGAIGTAVAVDAPDNIVGIDGSRVDFIKYDVEGAESEALRGSAGIIRAHRPQILLSVYHRSEDIFALPLQLHALRPDYRLFLRRFPYIPAWDLNLYAI